MKEKESALREKVDDFLGDFARNREEGYKNDLVHHLQTEVLSANDILCKKMEQIHEDAQRPLRGWNLRPTILYIRKYWQHF